MNTVKARSFVIAGTFESSNTGFTIRTIKTFTTLCYLSGGVAVFGTAYTKCWSERRCGVTTANLMTFHFNGTFWTLRLIEITAVNTGTHDDLALSDITAVRQDGKDGGRVENPVNHMDDPIGRHNVGARQMDAVLAQQDLTILRHSDGDNLIGHRLNSRERSQRIDSQHSLGVNMVSEKFLKFMFGIAQHVQEAAISGSVHSLVGGDEHSQGSWTPKRRG